jgi:hypothetical protein
MQKSAGEKQAGVVPAEAPPTWEVLRQVGHALGVYTQGGPEPTLEQVLEAAWREGDARRLLKMMEENLLVARLILMRLDERAPKRKGKA